MVLGKAIMHINNTTIKCAAAENQASPMPEEGFYTVKL